METSAISKILDINGKNNALHFFEFLDAKYFTNSSVVTCFTVQSAVLLAQKVVKHMPRGGSIVFVSSYSAFSPSAPIGFYAVSKTALLGLTKALAEELGPDGITVNCIAPGVVPTKFADALVANDELKALNESRTFLGRLGLPEDMAAAVAYLVSPDASYVTGETLVVAGGMQSRL